MDTFASLGCATDTAMNLNRLQNWFAGRADTAPNPGHTVIELTTERGENLRITCWVLWVLGLVHCGVVVAQYGGNRNNKRLFVGGLWSLTRRRRVSSWVTSYGKRHGATRTRWLSDRTTIPGLCDAMGVCVTVWSFAGTCRRDPATRRKDREVGTSSLFVFVFVFSSEGDVKSLRHTTDASWRFLRLSGRRAIGVLL
jgi:hypothetical protein